MATGRPAGAPLRADEEPDPTDGGDPAGRLEAPLPEPPDGGGVRLVAVPRLAAPAGRGRDWAPEPEDTAPPEDPDEDDPDLAALEPDEVDPPRRTA